jgi:hypothetical protein
MPLVTRYDTPSSIRDFPAGSAFYANWHNYIAGELAASTPGGIGGGEFYDASEINVKEVGRRALNWMAFPRDVRFLNRDNKEQAYIDAENRLVQNEYCEWRVTKKGSKITKVIFISESPEYWEELWAEDPIGVVALYKSILGNNSIQKTDLESSPGVYKRKNIWNTTKGIVHLIQRINTLNAAFGLSQDLGASSVAKDNYEMNLNFFTSVDPRVQNDVGTLVRKGLSVTLAEPIGLYITGWDDTGWTKPNGQPVGNYWKPVRGNAPLPGQPGHVLRLEYEVPASEGFVVGDIRIGGRPIKYGGQIAEHVTVAIVGTAGTRVPTGGAKKRAVKRGANAKKTKKKASGKQAKKKASKAKTGRGPS